MPYLRLILPEHIGEERVLEDTVALADAEDLKGCAVLESILDHRVRCGHADAEHNSTILNAERYAFLLLCDQGSEGSPVPG